MRVYLQRRAIQNFNMCVSLQQRAQKCMNPAHDVRGNPQHTKITILPQFRTSDQHEDERVAPATSKLAFHHSFGRPMSTKRRKGCATTQRILHFTTVLGVRRARSDERVATPTWKFAFHHSFGRPTSTKWREGCEGHVQNSQFTTVLDVQRARSDEPNPPGVKRRKKFLKKSWSTAILSSHSQQLFSAAIRSSHSHQPLLSSSPQQLFSPAILITSLWSGVGGQLLSHHVAVVRGWWSAIVSSCCCGQGLVVSYCHIMLLWSGVDGQLLSHHVAVVRGWLSAILIMLLWSGVGCQLFSHHVAVVRGWWSAIVSSCCCGQGLMVSYCLIMLLWSPVGGPLFSSCCCGQGLVVNYCHHVWRSIEHTFFRRTLSRSFREKGSQA